MFGRSCLALVILLGSASSISSQTRTLSGPEMVGSAAASAKRHYRPTGEPCLTLSGYAKAQLVNKEMFDHWITVKNDCLQRIKVQVCYFGSQDCIMLDAPPYGENIGLLGVYPKLKDFRYDYKEQF